MGLLLKISFNILDAFHTYMNFRIMSSISSNKDHLAGILAEVALNVQLNLRKIYIFQFESFNSV